MKLVTAFLLLLPAAVKVTLAPINEESEALSGELSDANLLVDAIR